MGTTKKRLRAIDLYSGVGGWSLGLSLAGIEVVASYEHWGLANETNFKNNRHHAQTVDIRRLGLDELPKDIDIVVGSPPCTQFSFSNRGGKGDIADGLRDIIKFLKIVDHLRPKVWAMENVPRVAKIIEKELLPGGRLRRFRHLNIVSHIINMEEFGLPQRRRRCIAGNFDFSLLSTYATKTTPRTLGQVVAALAADLVVDPIYGIKFPTRKVSDHIIEDSLNSEEVRINKANKTVHPIYNSMPFPDRLNRSVRTITATCTRVSRESIVIENSTKPATVRRLTIRERASLQGFPINFQFYGTTYSQKLRMVGNAIPPAFCYYLAQAFKGTASSKLPRLADRATTLKFPNVMATDATPDRAGAHYPADRTFRFSIPSLRLKSGVRFELANAFETDSPSWKVSFYFGTSKSIHSMVLDKKLHSLLLRRIPNAATDEVNAALGELAASLRESDIARMQTIWSHRGPGRTTPFMILDRLALTGELLIEALKNHKDVAAILIADALEAEYGTAQRRLLGVPKLARNAPLILSGLLIGSLANIELERRARGATLRSPRQALR